MPFAGKFGRVQGSGVPLGYLSAWRARFRRDPIDTTNFETTTDGVNVGEEQLTGTLGTTFTVEGYVDQTAGMNLFYPYTQVTMDFLYRKTSPVGFRNVVVDILGFEPGGGVKDVFKYTAEVKVNGLLGVAA